MENSISFDKNDRNLILTGLRAEVNTLNRIKTDLRINGLSDGELNVSIDKKLTDTLDLIDRIERSVGILPRF